MTDPWLTALNDSIATINALHPDERPITPSVPDALERHRSEPDDGGYYEQLAEDRGYEAAAAAEARDDKRWGRYP